MEDYNKLTLWQFRFLRLVVYVLALLYVTGHMYLSEGFAIFAEGRYVTAFLIMPGIAFLGRLAYTKPEEKEDIRDFGDSPAFRALGVGITLAVPLVFVAVTLYIFKSTGSYLGATLPLMGLGYTAGDAAGKIVESIRYKNLTGRLHDSSAVCWRPFTSGMALSLK